MKAKEHPVIITKKGVIRRMSKKQVAKHAKGCKTVIRDKAGEYSQP